MSIPVTFENIEQIVKANSVVLLKFSSVGCAPCKKLSENLEAALAKFPGRDIAHYEIDVAQNLPLAQKFMIFAVPVLIVFRNGAEVRRLNGAVKSAEIEKILGGLIS